MVIALRRYVCDRPVGADTASEVTIVPQGDPRRRIEKRR